MSLFGQASTSTAFGQQSTTTPSLFGQTSTAPSGGLFGSTPAAPPAGGGLFGSSTPAAGGFGQPAGSKPTFSFGTPASTPAPTGGLFGSTPAAPATTSTPFSFGQQTTATPQATSSPFSFGAPSAATPTPAAGGGLFGGQSSTAATGGGLFGGGGLASSTPAAGGGLFGQSAPAPAGGSLFGGFGAPPKPSPFGAPTPAVQTPQPGASTTGQPASGISKQSKLKDLPDNVRTAIEQIDAGIRAQVQVSEELRSRELGTEITKTTELYNEYLAESTAVSNLLSEDSRAATSLRQRLEVDLTDLGRITAIIEGFKNPQVKGAAAKAVANFPFEYFSRKAEEFKERIARYSNTMDQIQQQVESSHGLERNPSAIIPTLRAQHSSFMSLASSIATLNNDLKNLKDDFRMLWREKTGSVQDPFRRANVSGVETGIGNMDIR